MPKALEDWLFDPAVTKLIIALAAVLLVVSLVRLLHRVLGRRIQDLDTRYRMRKFTSFVGYVIAILVIAFVFSEKLGGLHVALGLTGAGLAFALQEVIASVAGWLAISVSRSYKIGDRIRLAGTKGDVIDIGMLRTTLMEIGEWVDGDLYNGRVVRVANSFVFKEPVFNYSGDFPFLWDEVILPIRYGSDREAARAILQRAADDLLGEYASQAAAAWQQLVRKFRIEDALVTPLVTMSANENWLTFTVRYVVDYRQRRTTKNRLFERILDDIERSGGKITVASTSLEVSMAHTHHPGGDDAQGPVHDRQAEP